MPDFALQMEVLDQSIYCTPPPTVVAATVRQDDTWDVKVLPDTVYICIPYMIIVGTIPSWGVPARCDQTSRPLNIEALDEGVPRPLSILSKGHVSCLCCLVLNHNIPCRF